MAIRPSPSPYHISKLCSKTKNGLPQSYQAPGFQVSSGAATSDLSHLWDYCQQFAPFTTPSTPPQADSVSLCTTNSPGLGSVGIITRRCLHHCPSQITLNLLPTSPHTSNLLLAVPYLPHHQQLAPRQLLPVTCCLSMHIKVSQLHWLSLYSMNVQLRLAIHSPVFQPLLTIFSHGKLILMSHIYLLPFLLCLLFHCLLGDQTGWNRHSR